MSHAGDFLSEHLLHVDIFYHYGLDRSFKSIVLFPPVFYSAGKYGKGDPDEPPCPESRFIDPFSDYDRKPVGGVSWFEVRETPLRIIFLQNSILMRRNRIGWN